MINLIHEEMLKLRKGNFLGKHFEQEGKLSLILEYGRLTEEEEEL